MSPGIYAIIVAGVNRYGEENLVKIFQIGQKFGGNAIEVSEFICLYQVNIRYTLKNPFNI